MSRWKPSRQVNTTQPVAPSRRRHTGNAYEQLAAAYLCSQGLQLISSNYQCRLGEIDLIMKDGQTLVFVEVRYRLNSRFMSPVISINTRKQRKLLQTAQVYLMHHHLDNHVASRIDVVGITRDPADQHCCFEWIRNAIQPGI